MQRQSSKSKKRFNIWFWLFWFLILLMISGVGSVTYLALSPTNTQVESSKGIEGANSSFDIVLTKEQINRLAEHYTAEASQKSGRKIGFTINKYVNIYGSVDVLGQSLNVGMSLNPVVTKNGNIALKAHKINVGQLQLPTALVLGIYSRTYKVPEWVEVKPQEKEILLDLGRIKTINGFNFKAKTIDIPNNRFVFEGRIK